jgi:hypothetical protein
LDCALGELKSSSDRQVLQSSLAVVGLAKGLVAVGAVLWYHDESTLRDYLEEHLAWTELYASKPANKLCTCRRRREPGVIRKTNLRRRR